MRKTKKYRRKDLQTLLDYATREGFMYSRALPGGGYAEFLTELDRAFKNGELTLDEAMDRVSYFKPGKYRAPSFLPSEET
jgi:hypothetical protein